MILASGSELYTHRHTLGSSVLPGTLCPEISPTVLPPTLMGGIQNMVAPRNTKDGRRVSHCNLTSQRFLGGLANCAGQLLEL